ncbi:protein phosphatase PTC7 homolog isoform X3 [Eurosta solidaginis]|uniref:protein phosphatase PTC7 homolog isoform X3 n=1 Tax=Eurosta solidaginis TaxID=178769 RepID=UPI003530BEA9
MHSLSWTTRVISRALRSGFSTLLETTSNATANVSNASKQRPHFVSVVCGFPKDFLTSKYKPGKYGEDSWFKTSTTNADVLGSSTACVLVLNRENSTVYTANIGDSGFMVVREGEIIHKSEEQQHYFNTPFQLSLPPPGHGHNVLSDSPDSADTLSFSVMEGDVILVATDGVFDNVPERLLLDVLKECEGVTDPVKLQMTANSLALMARSLSFDSEFMSPFAINARRNNINATVCNLYLYKKARNEAEKMLQYDYRRRSS